MTPLQESLTSVGSPPTGLLVWISLLMLLVTASGCDRKQANPAPPPAAANQPASPLDVARAAWAGGNLEAAETAVIEHLVGQPTDVAGLQLAGDIASAKGEGSKAAELYRSAIDSAASAPASLYEKLGRQWMAVGLPYEAAAVLRESVGEHPDDAKVRADYAGLVASLGMVRDATDHLRWLLRRGRGGLNELIMLANSSVPQTDQAICDYAIKHQPRDRRALYPLALSDAFEGNWQRANERLVDVTEAHPDFAPAWALRGRVLVELGQQDELLDWQQRLPPAARGWTDYWIAAGIWAENQQQPALAAVAFSQALALDDFHAEALGHLATNLAQLGDTDQAAIVARRAADVSAMHDGVESFFSWRKNSQQAAIGIAKALSQLGRPWEAEAWARASLGMTQQLDPEATATHRELFEVLTSTTPWQSPELAIGNQLDLSELPEFRWAASQQPRTIDSAIDADAAGFRFVDEASSRGLIHTCAISKAGPENGIAIYQSNAGGAGVIDYDLDGWPDLYLTMVDGTPLCDDSSPNHLYRNVGGQFSNVTGSTAVGDRGYSQGIAVGDFNADGFPDIWVANIGSNRLYRNNGDGTFQDITQQANLSGERWTTSLAIADLDGDGHADLFEVNYCGDTAAYTQECIDSEVHQPRSCSPLVFQAERDRVWRGVGDGTFADATDRWLGETTAGHGLGLVIGRIDSQDGVDVYVANDMTANQFWSSAVTDDHLTMSDQAAVRGLAVNGRSQSQASMGMALGDADSDGDLDLFLTHFTDDYNTLYEQVSDGIWSDRSSRLGLADPSISMLAFGTEWIDANNDGALELLVANGNVDDFSHQGHPLRMLPQFFVRGGDRRWQQADREQLGVYFQTPCVGRAVVTLDLNRDFLPDAVITHLFDPVAALVNHTETVAGSTRVFLRGRSCGRDAIGAVVEADIEGRTRVFQLTAGDGFQCSNERCLTLGLGTAESAERVTVRWSSGPIQEIGTLRGGRDYMVVEGEEQPFELGLAR